MSAYVLREIGHFLRHAPGVAKSSLSMSHVELFDVLMERAEQAGLAERRASLARGISGDVLEVGCGTGRMFRFYESDARVTAIEPDKEFLDRARGRSATARAEVSIQLASVNELPFAAARFDAIVIANVLCSVPSVRRALEEVHRVLKPGGELRLMEHILSERTIPRWAMHVFNPLWRLWNRQGCNMNRRVLEPLRDAGFTVLELERFQIFAPGLPAFPSVQIRASRLGATGL